MEQLLAEQTLKHGLPGRLGFSPQAVGSGQQYGWTLFG
jgi:hypothetical protein